MAATSANVLRAAVSTITVDAIDLGFTFEPYVLTVESTNEDVLVEQQFGPIRRPLTARSVNGTVTLAESTLAVMAVAFGMPASNISGSTLTLDQDERGEVTFVVVGKTGSANNAGSDVRTFSFPQTVIGGAVAYNVAKLVESSLPVEFAHLASSSGVYGTIVDS